MDMIAIGSRIKEARERVHLTQEDLAEIVDISPTHMSVIERGVQVPKLDTFFKIINGSLQSRTNRILGLLQQQTDQSKTKGLAVCITQTASPLDCLNNLS